MYLTYKKLLQLPRHIAKILSKTNKRHYNAIIYLGSIYDARLSSKATLVNLYLPATR